MTTTASIQFDKAGRLKALPPYLFVELDRAKRKLKAEGKDVIDLGVGDPDLPTPQSIIAVLKQTVDDPANHRYSMSDGMPELRRAIADWYRRRFDVALDPDTEILPLLGSKEGIAHFPTAMCDPGDVVLCPDPGYPPYAGGAILAGAEPVAMPLLEENAFFPDFGELSQRAARKAKIMYLNYPNNPTAALATRSQFEEAIAFAQDYNICLAHDAAYTEIAFDGNETISFLQMPGAKEIGVEFHSVSKTFNMTGWRVGWVAGNADAVAALSQLKGNLDSGIFQPLQWAAIEALTNGDSLLKPIVATYQQRRDLLVNGLNEAGWEVTAPKAGLYIWTKVPGGLPSMAYSQRILQKANVVITPGVGFGQAGEGYVRLSLTVPTERIEEAVGRIRKAM